MSETTHHSLISNTFLFILTRLIRSWQPIDGCCYIESAESFGRWRWLLIELYGSLIPVAGSRFLFFPLFPCLFYLSSGLYGIFAFDCCGQEVDLYKHTHPIEIFTEKLPPRLIELGPGEAALDGLAFGPSSSARTYRYCRPFPSQPERGARVEAHQSIMEA